MLDNNVILSQKQGDQIVNLLLTHTENCREMIKRFFVPEATEALEEEVKVCQALLDAILPQLSDKEDAPDKEEHNKEALDKLDALGMLDVASVASEQQRDKNTAVMHCINVIMHDITDAVNKGEVSCQFSQTIRSLYDPYGLDINLEAELVNAFATAGYMFELGDKPDDDSIKICWGKKEVTYDDEV